MKEEDKVAKSQDVAGEQAQQVSVQTFKNSKDHNVGEVLSHAGHFTVEELS